MSFLVEEWASEAAPVVDTYERIILMRLASRAGDDGRGAYPGIPSMARAALCDEETVKRRLRRMRLRGVIAYGDQGLVSHYRKDRQPKVYDLLVPFEWYSEQQISKVNQQCLEVGLEPLTPENRPPLAVAPPKKRRADAGVPNPKRSPKKRAIPPSGALTEPPTEPETANFGGSLRAPDGGSLSRPTGALVEPQISQTETRPSTISQTGDAPPTTTGAVPAVCLPVDPEPTTAGRTAVEALNTPGAELLRGLRLATPVTTQVVRQHHQAVTALLETWPEPELAAHFEREATGRRVSNPMGLLVSLIRTTEPYRSPAPVRVVRSGRESWPVWCGADGSDGTPPCNEVTRMREPQDPRERVYRCPTCYPSTVSSSGVGRDHRGDEGRPQRSVSEGGRVVDLLAAAGLPGRASNHAEGAAGAVG